MDAPRERSRSPVAPRSVTPRTPPEFYTLGKPWEEAVMKCIEDYRCKLAAMETQIEGLTRRVEQLEAVRE